MTVKDLIKHLSKFDGNLDVVFYNETLDENHWGCELSVDDCRRLQRQRPNNLSDDRRLTTNPEPLSWLGVFFYLKSTLE
jgi:hypothetical protein